MKRKKVSGYSVFEYWYGKEDCNGEPWILDPGEKTCFKCGYLDSEICSGESLKDFWDKSSRLEKAHVVPKSLKGDDSPKNIILLCPTCHKESPDTIDYEINLTWIADHRGNRMMKICESVFSKLSESEINNLLDVDSISLVQSFENKVGPHSFSFSDSSIELGLLQTLKEAVNK